MAYNEIGYALHNNTGLTYIYNVLSCKIIL